MGISVSGGSIPSPSASLKGWCLNDKRREYLRTYQREWVAKRRREWLEENGPCVKCDSWDRLEIDHIDPKIKTSPIFWSYSKQKREEELVKCQVLCYDCHLGKTSEYRAVNKKSLEELHGTYTGYLKHKCRCELCREYKRKAHRREKNRFVRRT